MDKGRDEDRVGVGEKGWGSDGQRGGVRVGKE